jgi:hypothetical protein
MALYLVWSISGQLPCPSDGQIHERQKTLQVRSEAWALDGRTWLIGTDSRLMSTLKTDLMGTVGRTTR